MSSICNTGFKILHSFGITVVCSNEAFTANLLEGFNNTTDTGVNCFTSLDSCFIYAGMANHVAVRVITDDYVILATFNCGTELVGKFGRAHFRLQVIGSNLRTLNKFSFFTFKHGFDLDYPPYSYLQDDGSVGGFDVELCQAVCEYLGWGYQAVPFNWDAKDAELNAGSCDCIWSGFTKEGRENDYTWGVTYSNNTQVILVASDSGIKTLADLAGKVVGVQNATSAMEMLEDEDRQKALADTFAELKVFETYTIAFSDLKAGAIDAIAIDVTAGNFYISGAE